MVNFYRDFCPDMAEKAVCLYDLLHKSAVFEWKKEHEEAFKRIKSLLVSPPLLWLAVPGKPFMLSTDASDRALGAVLSQRHDGNEHPVAFASRVLTDAESKYSVIEKELLAIVFAVKRFREHLYGKPFLVYTDHNPLTHIDTMKDVYGRIARWIMYLQGFQFKIQHRPGKDNGNADALSRCQTVSTIVLDGNSRDEDYAALLRGEGIPVSSEYARHQNRILVENAGLWIICGGKKRRVVPCNERLNLLAGVHGLGHFGVRKSAALVALSSWWPGLGKDVAAYVRTCTACQRRKMEPNQTSTATAQHIRARYPLECVAWDVMGPLPESRSGNKFILVIVDVFSRWTEAYPVPNALAETLADSLWKNFISRFGPPKRIHSDRGRNLNADVVQRLYKMWGIGKSNTVAYYPQGNGIVERMNRSLQDIIAKKLLGQEPSSWDELIPAAVFAYNVTPHTETKASPHLLFLGREACIPLHEGEFTYEDANSKSFEVFWNVMSRNAEQMKPKVNTENAVKVGDMVLLNRPSNDVPKKFQLPWKGPYRVMQETGQSNLTLNINGKETMVNRNQVKPFEVMYMGRVFKPRRGRCVV